MKTLYFLLNSLMMILIVLMNVMVGFSIFSTGDSILMALSLFPLIMIFFIIKKRLYVKKPASITSREKRILFMVAVLQILAVCGASFFLPTGKDEVSVTLSIIRYLLISYVLINTYPIWYAIRTCSLVNGHNDKIDVQ